MRARFHPRTIRSLVKLCIFMVITALLTFVLGVTIANGGIGSGATTYRADFTDVTSLLPGDDVRIAGVRVGQVTGIKLVDRDVAQVTFVVQKGVHLLASTQADVRFKNLVGQRYIELVDAPGSDTPLPPNGLIPLSQTQPAVDLTLLFNGFKPLFQALTPQDVNAFAYEVVQTLQGEGGTVDQLISNTASLTNTLADRDAVIGAVIDNLNAVLATVDQRDQGLSELIIQLQRLVTGLAGDRTAIADSLGNINSLAVSTTQLLQDIRPPLPLDLTSLSGIGNTLATTVLTQAGPNVLDNFLHYFPAKLNSIIRTATYGSWFNFYLCDADFFANGRYSPLRLHNNVPACNAVNS